MDPNNVPEKVQEAIFNQLLDRPENKVCADCPNKSPTWASIDFGVFICLRCSGAHRRLSPVVTRVRSAKIDTWTMGQVEIISAIGNKIANGYYEMNAPAYYKKPDISTSLEDVFEFIKTKYVKAVYAPKDRLVPVKEFLEAKKDGQTTAGSFNKSYTFDGPATTTTTTTTVNNTKPTIVHNPVNAPSKNLMDFDEHDFKSAPEKTMKLGIPKPSAEVKFASNNGSQKATIDLLDFGGETKNPGPTNNIQKTKSTDPFSFGQPQQQVGANGQHQKSHSTQFDSNNLYDLYKTGGNPTPGQNQPKQVPNGPNYSGGQSNYAFLDMMGGNNQQQNRFGQQPQQQQQQFGFQNTTGTSGMNMNQPKSGGFGTQQNSFGPSGGFGGSGGFNSGGFGSNNGGSGFNMGGGSGGFNSNGGGFNSTGGGFNSTGGGFNSTGGGFNMGGGSGFNSTGGGFNSGSVNSKPNGNSFGTTPQQQPFSFGPSTTTTTTTTTQPSFGFNTTNSSNNQSTSVNTGFSFF